MNASTSGPLVPVGPKEVQLWSWLILRPNWGLLGLVGVGRLRSRG